MATGLAAALAGGVASALFYLSVLFGGMGALILGYLAPFPLLLIGLSLGPAAAGLAAVAGTATALAASGSAVVTVAYALTAAFPAWLVTRQALLARTAPDGSVEWYPSGRLLLVLVGLGLGAVAVAFVLALGEPGGLVGIVREALARMAAEFVPEGEAWPADAEAFWYVQAVPGLVTVSWLLMVIINASLAQGVLMRFGRNRRPGMRLSDVVLPSRLATVFLAALAAALALPEPFAFPGLTVVLVLSVPFGFAGLAVVHAFARSRSARTPILVGFYLCLVLFGWPIVMMVGLGVIEQWLELRRRMAPAPSKEDE